MNRLNFTQEGYASSEEAEAPEETAALPVDEETQKPVLDEPRAAAARRSDIADLDKRVQRMFVQLEKNLSDRLDSGLSTGRSDQERLIERLGEVEQSVNALEGMMRIELGAEVRAAVTEILEERRGTRARPWRFYAIAGAAILAGIGAGLFFHSQVLALVTGAQGALSGIF